MAEVETWTEGEVRIVAMNRPEAGNRVNAAMARRLIEALEEARTDRAIGACVLTGRGDSFCLGGEYWSAGPAAGARMEFARSFIDLVTAMARLGKPLVAAVNGNAHAGGFSLLLACDLAIAARSATMGLPEVEKGLFPFLALAIVRDALPKKLLFDLAYSARLMDSAEALSRALINEAVENDRVLPRAVEFAQALCHHNRDIVMMGRDLYYNMRGMGPEEALEASRMALGAALSARDEASPGWNG